MAKASNGWHRADRTTPAARARAREYASREYRQAKQTIQTKIDRGEHVTCWRCHRPVTGHAWHLGHDDHDRRIIRGAECIPCNLSAAARKGQRATRRERPRPRAVIRRTW